MDYKETLEFLFSRLPMYQRQGKSAYKDNLDNTIALDRYFDSPHKKFKCIHVAGTNGKGSVSHLLASVLQEAGYRVGLYTSPHLRDFRERIKINGVMIGEESVVEFVKSHKKIIEEVEPSFFELTVAMAFNYFAEQSVDIAVVEVGMGGRLDSTNIILPEISIITNIGFDHTEFLGSTLEEIATEKAGIIKPNIPVIVGETQEQTAIVFRQKAKVTRADLYFADIEYVIDYTMTSIDAHQIFNVRKDNSLFFKDLEVGLLGVYQKKNVVTCLKSIDILKSAGYKIDEDHLRLGFRNVVMNTGLQGRWQILGNNPLIVCDTGHNIDGLTQVVEQIANTAYKKLYMVIGFVNDKNIDALLGILPLQAHYCFVQASIPRALNVNELSIKASSFGLNGNVFQSVEDGYNWARQQADRQDMIFVGGSTFVVAEIV